MMKQREMTLRGFAERRPDGTWYLHCIDLCLDAEAETYFEARKKLDDAIILYLEWALEDAKTLKDLRRPSPMSFRLRYVRAWIAERIRAFRDRFGNGNGGTPERQFVTHPDVRARQRAAVYA